MAASLKAEVTTVSTKPDLCSCRRRLER